MSSYRSTAIPINTSATGDSTMTEPASTAQGDALIALCVTEVAVTTAANVMHPADWTLLYSGTQGAFKWNVAYKIRGASAPGLVWTIAGTSVYREIQMICITGATAQQLDSQSASGGSSASGTHDINPPATVAVASASTSVCGGVNWGSANPGAWVAPSTPGAYSTRTVATAGTYDGVMATRALSAPGSEDPGVFTGGAQGSFDFWDGFTVTFADSGGGGGTALSVNLTEPIIGGGVLT